MPENTNPQSDPDLQPLGGGPIDPPVKSSIPKPSQNPPRPPAEDSTQAPKKHSVFGSMFKILLIVILIVITVALAAYFLATSDKVSDEGLSYIVESTNDVIDKY